MVFRLEKSEKRNGKAGASCLFWSVLKARNEIVFRYDMLSIQWLKMIFFFLLWSKAKLSLSNGLLTIAEFIDWVRCK